MSPMSPMKLLLLLLPLLLPSSAHAQDATAAEQHYQQATHLFETQHFWQAAQEFQRAFLADNRRPWFIYNIGQSYERLAATEKDPNLALLALRRAFVAYRDHYLAISHRLRTQAQNLRLLDRSHGLQLEPGEFDGLERGDGNLQATLPWPASPPTAPETPPTPNVSSPKERTHQALPGGALDRAFERQAQTRRGEEDRLRRRRRWRLRTAGLATLLPGVGASVLGGHFLGSLAPLRTQLAKAPEGAHTPDLYPLLQKIERNSLASSVLLPAGLALVSVGLAALIPSW